MMKADDLKKELKDFRLKHLTDDELLYYVEQKLDKVRLAMAEAHLKQCFVCEQKLMLLKEDSTPLESQTSAAEIARLYETARERLKEEKPITATPIAQSRDAGLLERL